MGVVINCTFTVKTYIIIYNNFFPKIQFTEADFKFFYHLNFYFFFRETNKLALSTWSIDSPLCYLHTLYLSNIQHADDFYYNTKSTQFSKELSIKSLLVLSK